jgi:hypothetical protein
VSALTDIALRISLSPAAWAGAVRFHGTELPGTVLHWVSTAAALHGLQLPPDPAPDPPVEYHLGPPGHRILIGNGWTWFLQWFLPFNYRIGFLVRCFSGADPFTRLDDFLDLFHPDGFNLERYNARFGQPLRPAWVRQLLHAHRVGSVRDAYNLPISPPAGTVHADTRRWLELIAARDLDSAASD